MFTLLFQYLCHQKLHCAHYFISSFKIILALVISVGINFFLNFSSTFHQYLDNTNNRNDLGHNDRDVKFS